MSAHLSNPNRRPSSSKSILPQKETNETRQKAQEEIIRQAHISFNLHAAGIIISMLLGLAAGVLALTERIPEASVSAAAAGLITYSAQSNKDAQDKLEDLLEDLQKIP